jgi:hypothetical protein|tara:strand:+ start:607 stop:786 length:180 start_codon:yes stop_codon:yes gene_type:complete
MERMKDLQIGDLVQHRNALAWKWGFGIVRAYRKRHEMYEIVWPDGKIRTHTIEMLKQIA